MAKSTSHTPDELARLRQRVAELEHAQAERQRAEKLLGESDRRFRVLTENSFDLLCEIDERANFQYVSPNYFEVLGYRPEDLLGTSALAIVHDDDREATHREIARAFTSGWGKQTLRVRRQRGDWRWFECAGKLYQTPEGERRVLVVSRDLTDRVEGEERFRAIAEVNPVPILISRVSDGRILFANRRLAETLGVPHGSLIGQSTATFYDKPADRDRLMQQFSEHGQVDDYQLKARRADGSSLWLFVSNRRITYHGEECALTGILDITQRIEAENTLRRERTLLKQMLDLQERDRQLVAYEIHDGLVQEMTGAVMFLQSAEPSMQLGDADRAKFDHAVALLQSAVQEARRLIDGLRPPILDEEGVVAAVEHLVAGFIDRDSLAVEFTHNMPPGRLPLALENTIYRIIQEALTNVRRHAKVKNATVELTMQDGRVHFLVRDEGVGFDPHAVPPTRYGLTGLQERVRIFGGRVAIESHRGRGTTIRVELPVVDEPELEWAADGDR
jgi:PAS domain S-box-containing protein